MMTIIRRQRLQVILEGLGAGAGAGILATWAIWVATGHVSPVLRAVWWCGALAWGCCNKVTGV